MHEFGSLPGRRGVLAAAAVAGGVFAVIVVQQLASMLAFTVFALGAGPLPPMYLATFWGSGGGSIVQSLLTVVVGIFLCLWLIAPIAAELRLARVVTRAILATGVGASLTMIVTASMQLLGAFSGVGSLFGNSFPELPYGSVMQSLIGSLDAGLMVFVQLSPAVVLAGVLLWLWLQKHPSRHVVGGMLDEV